MTHNIAHDIAAKQLENEIIPEFYKVEVNGEMVERKRYLSLRTFLEQLHNEAAEKDPRMKPFVGAAADLATGLEALAKAEPELQSELLKRGWQGLTTQINNLAHQYTVLFAEACKKASNEPLEEEPVERERKRSEIVEEIVLLKRHILQLKTLYKETAGIAHTAIITQPPLNEEAESIQQFRGRT